MQNKKLSIIVPIYNVQGFLDKCVESILAQTYKSLEIILVDDGSTDKSSEICDKYSLNDNVKVIHKSNGGIVSARKAGVEAATGEYVGFVDADDWVDKVMFEELMSKAIETDSDIVISGYIREDKTTSIVFYNQCAEGYYDKQRLQEELYPGLIAYGTDWINQRLMPPHVVDKIFRRELIKPILDAVDERIIWCEDMVTVYPAVLSADSLYVLKDAFYHYRKNSSSVSYQKDRRALDLYPLAIKELLKTCDKFGGNLEKQLGFCFTYDLSEMLRIVFGMNYHKFYLFPQSLFEKGDRIVIYGAGAVGWSYYKQASEQDYFGSVMWTDSNKDKHNDVIVEPSRAFESSFDKVLIAVENQDVSLQIKSTLIENYNIPEEKIYWEKPSVVEGTFSYHYD